ncbi:MAG: MutS-related protein [Candidatus Humimicrobiaceae bacterium]
MVFESILFKRTDDSKIKEPLEDQDFFIDLNLDQIINTIISSRQEEYNLKPFFYIPLHNIEAIRYRQEIMSDLENKNLFEGIKTFAQKMHSMRVHLVLSDKLYYKYNKQGWFLEAIDNYCDAITYLVDTLSPLDLKSLGFLTFREYMMGYSKSDSFTSLQAEMKKFKANLSNIRYCILIKGNRVSVRKYESEIDYSLEVEKTFEKFKQGSVKDYRIAYRTDAGMNHVEANIVNMVAKLFPDIFSNLDNYCSKNTDYLDEKIESFDREVQFYIAYLEYIELIKLKKKVKFCYPQISDNCKEVYDYEGFDLALAYKLIYENCPIVCNDFFLIGNERIFVVSGPNQGGKTTFARTFGQLHYLAGLGCPVPGREAQLFICDRIFTHFEKEENIKNLRGKLQDDLVRVHSILDLATSNSIVIMNEIFTSTTLKDSIFLSKKIMEKIIQLKLLCVWVTFIVELSCISKKIVSVVSTVIPENPALRTYKIIRKPADGLAFALSIAEKYHLTKNHIKERIKS